MVLSGQRLNPDIWKRVDRLYGILIEKVRRTEASTGIATQSGETGSPQPVPTPNGRASSSRYEQLASSIYPVRTSAGKAVPQAALYHGRTWLRSVRAAQRRSIGGSDCARTLTCRSATTASPD